MASIVNISKEDVASLKQLKPTTGDVNISTIERWASLIGGSALMLFGVGRDILRQKPSTIGVILAVIGGGLIYRGASRHSYLYQALHINTASKVQPTDRMKVEKVVTINRPPEYLSHFWQDLDSFNQQAASGTNTLETTELPVERKNELAAWQKLKSSVTANSGYVHFDQAPQGRGTEVKVVFSYTAPLGKVGSTIGKILGKSPEQQVARNLRHFKEMMEAGEIPTIKGQSSGRDEGGSE
jgi:uncharacterized membrane protein